MARPASLPIAALVLSLAALVAGAARGAVADETGVDASPAAIARLFRSRCGTCHDAATAKGGLSLASTAEMMAGGDSGPAIVPGSPETSLLVAAVGYADDRVQMPPDGKLPATAIATLEEWVRRGLPWPDDGQAAGGLAAFDLPKRRSEHWCWQPPVAMPLLPVVLRCVVVPSVMTVSRPFNRRVKLC